MSIIDQAKAHFADISTPRIVEVPEWGEDENSPLKVYVTPLNLSEKQALFRLAKGDDLAVLVDAIILKATDEAGEKLFTKEHKRDLMRKADPAVIERLASEILGNPSIEDYEKN